MRGHESGIKYVPPALLEEWATELVKIGISYSSKRVTYSQSERIRNEVREYR
jgi:hypothetical protein